MDILKDFSWHSSSGIDNAISKKKLVKKIKASSRSVKKFVRVGGKNGDFLIHKSTKALWKFSDDGSHIEPVFDEDILTEEDLS